MYGTAWIGAYLFLFLTTHVGHYGQVFKAQYTKGSSTITVAVKTIKKYQSQKDHDDFLKEMSIMSKFVHPNVIKLYGLVQQGNMFH